MGLFELFKSKMEREDVTLLDKLFDILYENDSALNYDVNYLKRRLINKPYLPGDLKYHDEDDIVSIIALAIRIFFILQKKTQEDFVESLLANKKGLVTSNAEVVYLNFLNKYNSKKGQIIPIERSLSIIHRLSMISKIGVEYLKEFKELTPEGKFEVILFNSTFGLKYLQKEFKNNLREIQYNFILEVIKQAEKNNLLIDKKTLSEIVNIKLSFYSEEIIKLYMYDNYMPAKIYDAFYLNPLSLVPEVADDIIEVLHFNKALFEMMNLVADKINKL